jgi:hypothetical protein
MFGRGWNGAGGGLKPADHHVRAPILAPADDSGGGHRMGRKMAQRGPAGRRGPLDAGFERWLDRQLHDLYDPILNEPIPDDLARLLDRFDSRPDGQQGPAGQSGRKPDDED